MHGELVLPPSSESCLSANKDVQILSQEIDGQCCRLMRVGMVDAPSIRTIDEAIHTVLTNTHTYTHSLSSLYTHTHTHTHTCRQVALKKIMIRRIEDGVPKNALREIKALQEIDVHDNIVTLR